MKDKTITHVMRILSIIGFISIWILSSFSTLPTPKNIILGWDKLHHAIAFTCLAFTLSYWFPAKNWIFPPFRKTVFISFLLSIFWGVVDEVHQYFVPGRECSLADLAADSIGVISALALRVYLESRKAKKGKRSSKT
ncbi:VanZ family protein [Treponema phagedenis]|uniref:VanZ-like domain-containing protein n=2 Tax=Treponema phagedenis TaxID=162 RepID=A0AAE6IT42_TREPH|nr:VanZ family protein [Treponema phagedenis]QEJ94764.1 hypothetical protein FUT79_05765 [Treponema phagedenis]QEJ97701.1 hypothetical protein FUT82_06620 [Treponema phagedenis]QEK00670.1 hypothetical protein FUT84_05455 [Treponema phagedenis]QEK03269.1 hypothetical protein FUT83_05230 [Treponema phagedenis]QEK05679.1 hypothetical protein FUT80_02375 [Treponema phagedenis]